ncbi:MAG: 16S rRNA (uracil(1498)-N(3))-methyltransferase [Dactylosporangium sp.]|nr:16S rRNA (uracil(1498)-N(3))-methyltransferase [Dactylosporangium sp.]NNJ63571.1 16S rRNA (uracil(1498)-N(3))-methyltransferase [Dactylosporangium sp.]
MSHPQFLVERLPNVGHVRLDGPEGRHAAAVQRLRCGQIVLLSDGMGAVASTIVVAVSRDTLDLEIREHWTVTAPDPRLTVVQGLAKGDRGELAVQMMTEAGVDEIVPWAASRSVVQWHGQRGRRSLDRWRATARESAKQSRRSWIPRVPEPVAATGALAERLRAVRRGRGAALVLHEEADQPLSTVDLPSAGEICLVVGPEGGIADPELESFAAAGASPVRLGQTVLRTSTAGIAALAVLSARLGRW